MPLSLVRRSGIFVVVVLGGWGTDPTIMVGTWPEPEFPVFSPDGDLFRFNSPDISGDLVVDLADISVFAGDFFRVVQLPQ